MQRAFYWQKFILNNSTFNVDQRVKAAEWLITAALLCLPKEANMGHRYAQKALAYANKILKDKSIRPLLKKEIARLIATAYEDRILQESTKDYGKKSLEYQQYIVAAYEEKETSSSEESKKETSEIKSDIEKYGEKLLLLGFWRTHSSGIEKLKMALMNGEEHLCWSSSLYSLLKLVAHNNPAAIAALQAVVDFHLSKVTARIPDFVTALKTGVISEEELELQLSNFRNGRSWIPLFPHYEELDCSSLRELFYLARCSLIYPLQGYSIAKTAMAQFYQALAKACEEQGFENTFAETGRGYLELAGASVKSLELS